MSLPLTVSGIQQELFPSKEKSPVKKKSLATAVSLEGELARFNEFGKETIVTETEVDSARVPTYVNEFWTSKQRAASSLHEVSYRACFKPQLPRFFISRLSEAGDRVYDPFMGRGTTCLEAALMGRVPVGCDVNPLSRMLLEPRLSPPQLADVVERLQQINLTREVEIREDLLVFYHPATLQAISSLRAYFLEREASGEFDKLDGWIRMVALNRLTGHSSGFFSVYTLPPNQAVSLKSQLRINARRDQTPPERSIPALIVKKSKQLLKECQDKSRSILSCVYEQRQLLTILADQTRALEAESIKLVVTSPPFLDVVDYAGDNWLRVWFAGIDPEGIQITMAKKVPIWEAAMEKVFHELKRVLQPEGHIAFEVGEVRHGAIRLEESVVRSASRAGLKPRLILINDQEFTKTANCWGVDNGSKGTNTNRIVLLQK